MINGVKTLSLLAVGLLISTFRVVILPPTDKELMRLELRENGKLEQYCSSETLFGVPSLT